MAFEIVLASERISENFQSHRRYHGYVVYGRKNTVFIHTPRKDLIREVYESLLEASAEIVQLLIDEGRFADPRREQRGVWFGDSWVDLDVRDGDDYGSKSASSLESDEVGGPGYDNHRLSNDENNEHCPLTAVNRRENEGTAHETHRLPSYDDDRRTEYGSDFEELKDEHSHTNRYGDAVRGVESSRVRAEGKSGLNARNDEQDFADDEGEWHEL